MPNTPLTAPISRSFASTGFRLVAWLVVMLTLNPTPSGGEVEHKAFSQLETVCASRQKTTAKSLGKKLRHPSPNAAGKGLFWTAWLSLLFFLLVLVSFLVLEYAAFSLAPFFAACSFILALVTLFSRKANKASKNAAWIVLILLAALVIAVLSLM